MKIRCCWSVFFVSNVLFHKCDRTLICDHQSDHLPSVRLEKDLHVPTTSFNHVYGGFSRDMVLMQRVVLLKCFTSKGKRLSFTIAIESFSFTFKNVAHPCTPPRRPVPKCMPSSTTANIFHPGGRKMSGPVGILNFLRTWVSNTLSVPGLVLLLDG